MKNRTIWKFGLRLADQVEIHGPKGAKWLTLQVQLEDPYVWAEVDPDADEVAYIFTTFGTGHAIPPEFLGTYIGTYQTDGGQFIWHVYWEELK